VRETGRYSFFSMAAFAAARFNLREITADAWINPQKIFMKQVN